MIDHGPAPRWSSTRSVTTETGPSCLDGLRRTRARLLVIDDYLPAASENWSQRSALRVYYDQRGTGASAVPERVEDYSLKHLVGDLIGLVLILASPDG